MSPQLAVIILLIFFFLEYKFTYRPTSLKERVLYFLKDIPYVVVNLLIPPFLIKYLIGLYAKGLAFIFPGFQTIFPREEMYNIWVLILGFIFADFVGYITHRFLYHGPLFKDFHSLHHSAEVVRWHSAYRFHPVELTLTTTIIYLFFYPLGVPHQLFAELTIFNFVINYFSHSELPIGNKYVEYIFVTPNYHRIHHSIDSNNQRSNYSGIFSFWDLLFKSKNKSSILHDKTLGISS